MRNRTNVPLNASHSSIDRGPDAPCRRRGEPGSVCADGDRTPHRRLDQGITLPFSWFADPGGVPRTSSSGSSPAAGSTPASADWVAEPGQYFTCQAGLVPVVVVRDHDGSAERLRQHLPPPRDRGGPGQGQAGDAAVPLPRLDVRPRRLPAGGAAVASWSRASTAPSSGCCRSRSTPGGRSCSSTATSTPRRWRECLGGLPGIVPKAPASSFDAAALPRAAASSMLAANWKAVVENYLECYHCPTAHPGFSKVIDVDPDAYRLTSDRWFSSQVAPVRERRHERRRHAALPAGRQASARPTSTTCGRPSPSTCCRASRTCRVRVRPARRPAARMTVSDYFFGDDAAEEQIQELMAFGQQVGVEDQALVESIQRAAASGGLDQGRLMLSSEHLIQHFQRLVEQALRDRLPSRRRRPVRCGATRAAWSSSIAWNSAAVLRCGNGSSGTGTPSARHSGSQPSPGCHSTSRPGRRPRAPRRCAARRRRCRRRGVRQPAPRCRPAARAPSPAGGRAARLVTGRPSPARPSSPCSATTPRRWTGSTAAPAPAGSVGQLAPEAAGRPVEGGLVAGQEHLPVGHLAAHGAMPGLGRLAVSEHLHHVVAAAAGQLLDRLLQR